MDPRNSEKNSLTTKKSQCTTNGNPIHVLRSTIIQFVIVADLKEPHHGLTRPLVKNIRFNTRNVMGIKKISRTQYLEIIFFFFWNTWNEILPYFRSSCINLLIFKKIGCLIVKLMFRKVVTALNAARYLKIKCW